MTDGKQAAGNREVTIGMFPLTFRSGSPAFSQCMTAFLSDSRTVRVAKAPMMELPRASAGSKRALRTTAEKDSPSSLERRSFS